MLLRLKVPKLAYAACVNAVTQAIGSVDATAKVEADPKTKIVSINTQHSEAEIQERMRFTDASVGYPAA